MNKTLQALLYAAEDMIAVTGCCPYHYFECNMLMADDRKEFIEHHIQWCNKHEVNLDTQCKAVCKAETQLEGWRNCWVDYWLRGKRCIPPAWDKTYNPKKLTRKSTNNESTNHGEGEKCPKCDDGTQIRRESDRGPFWGCTNFPECRFLDPIKDKEPEPEPF